MSRPARARDANIALGACHLDTPTLRTLYNACDPSEPLDAADPRYADLDAGGARGGSLLERVAGRIEGSPRPVTQLIAAAPGAGLTTELNRLEARAAAPDRAGLLVLRVDLRPLAQAALPVDTAEILLNVLAACEQRTGAEAAGLPRGAVLNDVGSRLGVALGEQPAAALVERMREDQAMRTHAVEWIAGDFSRFADEARRDLNRLQQRLLQREHAAGLLVVVDGLGGLWGTLKTRADVLRGIERTFAEDATWLELPCHAVYAVPAVVLLRPGRRPLPLDELATPAPCGRDGRPQASARDALARLVRARIPEPDLRGWLGEDHAARLERIAERAGGAPRQVLRLVRELLLATTAAPMSDQELEHGLRRFAAEPAAGALSHEARRVLERLLAGDETLAHAEERLEAGELLAGGALELHREPGGTRWWDAAPGWRRAVVPAPV